jgi:purine-binding chemotaxis protein CheW
VPEAVRSPTVEEVRRILEERARALARPLQSEEQEETVALVELLLGAERYGVDIRKVRETHPLGRFCPVPGIPDFWAGIVNIRGTLYPCLDLRRYLGLEDDGGSSTSKRLVLVTGAGLTVGLIVDDAPAVRRVPAREIGPPLSGGTETGRNATSGVTRDLLAVLDVDAMMADPRLAIREEPR